MVPARPHIPRRLTVAALALLAAVVVAAPAAHARSETAMRDVVFVANAEGGTVTIIDATSLEVIGELDVLPDGEDATVGEDDPVQASVGQAITEAAGGDNFAQDQDLSPDGRTLYVSRGHRGDVAAFDLATGGMRWKATVSGFRADHMTLSQDGTRLYVSALTHDVVEVIDTDTGDVVDSFPTGEWPHDNHLSHDGTRLYNGSIGNIITPWEVRENRPAADPVLPAPYRLTVVDAESLDEIDSHTFDRGIRPFVVTEDDTRMYAQLSELHGVVEYDLENREELRRLELPIDDGVTEDDYSFEAPHHGLTLTPDETTLCAAGRASDYVALVDVARFEPTAIIDVGDAPSWAVTGPRGRHCFVANTRDDTVSVISYAAGREITRIEAGDGPKHLEVGRIATTVGASEASTAPRSTATAGGARTSGGASLPATGSGLGALAVALAVVMARPRPSTRTEVSSASGGRPAHTWPNWSRPGRPWSSASTSNAPTVTSVRSGTSGACRQ